MAASEARRFDPFDIVVVPFPYADRLAENRRPALVISNRKLAGHGLIWVAMITRRTTKRGRATSRPPISSARDYPRRRWCGRQRSPASSWDGSTGGLDDSTRRLQELWDRSCEGFWERDSR